MSGSRAGNHNCPTASQACAACKYQRRKCAPDCPLAPFFSPHRRDDFVNAHKFFGVGNILKMTKDLSPEAKSEAMKTIIYQANARARDPVGGCYRIVSALERHISQCEIEYKLVLPQLTICRAQLAEAHHNSINLDALSMYDTSDLLLQTEEQEQCSIVPNIDHSPQLYSVNKEQSPSSSLSEQSVRGYYRETFFRRKQLQLVTRPSLRPVYRIFGC